MGRLDKLLHHGDYEGAFAYFDKQSDTHGRVNAIFKMAQSLEKLFKSPETEAIIQKIKEKTLQLRVTF